MRKRFVGMERNAKDIYHLYWKWTTTIIDFSKYNYDYYFPNIQALIHYVGVPNDLELEHKWKNGDYSSEYNECLNFALENGLVEIIEDGYDKELEGKE